MRKTTIICLFVSCLVGRAAAQKGEKSIAAGLLIGFPENKNTIYSVYRSWNTGVGIEGIGQYNFTEKSAALLQLQLTRFSGHTYYDFDTRFTTSYISLSLKGGYRYQFTTSGFYANGLAGIEQGRDGYLNTAAALGLGKRFAIKDTYSIDAGLDYISGSINRINLKAVFSLLRRSKNN